MENKKERIVGLVIGLIGLVFLFHFSFGYVEFRTDDSTVAHAIVNLAYYFIDGWRRIILNYYDLIFWSIHWSYILFVWFYRGCIGYWAIKSVRVFYKKI